jgi:hypothetical protein
MIIVFNAISGSFRCLGAERVGPMVERMRAPA